MKICSINFKTHKTKEKINVVIYFVNNISYHTIAVLIR